MYWIYAGTFMLVIYFTLLNFFLAIIVDAFCDVRENLGAMAILDGFFTDLWRVFYFSTKWRWKRWPSMLLWVTYFDKVVTEHHHCGSFIKALAHEDDQKDQEGVVKNPNKVTVTHRQMMDNIPGLTKDALAEILAYYFALSPKILCKRNKKT